MKKAFLNRLSEGLAFIRVSLGNLSKSCSFCVSFVFSSSRSDCQFSRSSWARSRLSLKTNKYRSVPDLLASDILLIRSIRLITGGSCRLISKVSNPFDRLFFIWLNVVVYCSMRCNRLFTDVSDLLSERNDESRLR